MQIVRSLFDLTIFGSEADRAGRSTTQILQDIQVGVGTAVRGLRGQYVWARARCFAQARHSVTPFVPGTHWQSAFSHLVVYGGSYYSYLCALWTGLVRAA